jgi:Helix-turn-helix domain
MSDTTNVSADNYFAIIPEWVLHAKISATAIRLYAVLRRRADKNSSKCYPSRKLIASDLQVGSLSTVDRAMKELVKIGAVQVFHRSNKDEYTSNIYTVMSAPPSQKGVASKTMLGSLTNDEGVASNLGLGSLTDDDQTIVIKPESINQSHLVKDIYTDFEQFWKLYPKRTGKGAAREAFKKALKKTSLEAILAGAKRYHDDPNRDNEFTALATTWLNQERWDDDVLLPKNSKPKGLALPPAFDPSEFENSSAQPAEKYTSGIRKILAKKIPD